MATSRIIPIADNLPSVLIYADLTEQFRGTPEPDPSSAAETEASTKPLPTGCTGCGSAAFRDCPVHGRFVAQGMTPIANNSEREYDMTGYEDTDANTYLLIFSKKGVEISRARVIKYQLWTKLAHLCDTIEFYEERHHEPAPSVAADSPNQAGVETPTRGDLLKADCNERDETVSGVPEAGVDVSSSGTPEREGSGVPPAGEPVVHLSDKVHVRCSNCGSYELRVERAIEVARS
jgi:hypothetical protein